MVAVVSRLVLLLLCSLVHSAVGQCPLRTRVTPRQLRLEIGESVLFQCLDDSSDAAVGAARFFKDGAAITIDGSKYTRPLGHGLNVANVDLTDEGEYTCLPEDNSCSSDTVEGYLLVEPQLVVNAQQDYTASLGQDAILDCGLQFGSLRETRYIEWRTRSGNVLVSSQNPGAPGDRYQLDLETFQLTIEKVTRSDQQLSPFGGYICRSTGSNLLSPRTNLDAMEVYLRVDGSDPGSTVTMGPAGADENVTAGLLGSGETGLTAEGLAGIIVAVSLVVLVITVVCIMFAGVCVVHCMKRGVHGKKQFAFTPEPLQSPVEGGTVEHKSNTLGKLRSVTTSFKGSLFSLSKEHSYSASDFELRLDSSNAYVSHKDRITSVADSWCYSPKPQPLPHTQSNPTNPPNGGAPHYQYEVATMPLHGHNKKTPIHQHYDTPTKHAVDANNEEYTKVNAVVSQTVAGEETGKGMADEPGNYEVPISFTEQKAREYRSQTPSPESLPEVGDGNSHELGGRKGGVADVLAPPTEFIGEDTPMPEASGQVEEGSSQSTEVATHEGATFV